MYKMVAIDLDGTLLNSYGIVTENTKKVLKKIIENGVEIILASRKTNGFHKFRLNRNRSK